MLYQMRIKPGTPIWISNAAGCSNFEIAAAQAAPPPHRAAIDPHDPERSTPAQEK
jgi:hypothetical protein